MLGRLISSVPRVAACCSAQASSSTVPMLVCAPRRSMHSSPSSSAWFGKDKKTDEVASEQLDPENMPDEYRTKWEQDDDAKDMRPKAANHDGLVVAPPLDIPRPKDLSEYIDPTTGQLYPASLLPRAPKPSAADRYEARHTRQYKDELVVRDDHPLWAFFHRDKLTGKPIAMEKVEREDMDLRE